MSLKTIAAAKLLLANWSCPKLDRLLEQTEIRMSRALDYVSPNNIKVSCVQMALRAEMPAKDCLNLIISNLNSAVADGSQLVVFPEYIGLLPLLSSDSLFDYSYQAPSFPRGKAVRPDSRNRHQGGRDQAVPRLRSDWARPACVRGWTRRPSDGLPAAAVSLCLQQ